MRATAEAAVIRAASYNDWYDFYVSILDVVDIYNYRHRAGHID